MADEICVMQGIYAEAIAQLIRKVAAEPGSISESDRCYLKFHAGECPYCAKKIGRLICVKAR